MREGRKGTDKRDGTKRETDKDNRKSREREREEDGIRSRNSDCFAGDMIILSVSVFKEDVALDLRA